MWFQNIFRRHGDEPASPASETEAAFGELRLAPQVWRQLDRLQINASRYLSGSNTGQRPSTRHRPAADFREHRQYVPGDDVRFVDWRASARHEQFFLKQGEQPQETTVYLIIDCSASMTWGAPPKQNATLALAAALGYIVLAHEDRLHVLPFGELVPQHLGPIKGKGQFPNLLNYLRVIRFGGRADLTQSIIRFRRQVSRGGLVLILSDLLDTRDLSEMLAVFPRPTWEVTLFHLLHPQEIIPEVSGDLEMVDLETGRKANYDIDTKAHAAYRQHLQSWRGAIELTCIEHNTFYTLISTDWTLEREIIPHLRSVRVLQPI